jgi:hypothetical protein
MTAPAQFNFVDGGERANGNAPYYSQVGVSAAFSEFGGKNFFSTDNAGGASYAPGFSSVVSFTTHRLVVPNVDNCFILFQNSTGNVQISFLFKSGGIITVSSGSNVLGSSPSNTWFVGVVFQLQIHAVIDPTSGSIQVILNGNPTPVAGLNLTGINTAAFPSNLPMTEILYNNISGSGFLFRDVSIHDGTGSAPFNGFLGTGGAIYLPPVANVSAAFTPVGNVSNWENAAQTPPNATVDFNQSSTVGAEDIFSITQLPANVATVTAIKVFDYSFKSDTGSRALQKSLIGSGVTATGTENYLNETATLTEDTFTVCPNGSALTAGAVNAFNIGITVAA